MQHTQLSTSTTMACGHLGMQYEILSATAQNLPKKKKKQWERDSSCNHHMAIAYGKGEEARKELHLGRLAEETGKSICIDSETCLLSAWQQDSSASCNSTNSESFFKILLLFKTNDLTLPFEASLLWASEKRVKHKCPAQCVLLFENTSNMAPYTHDRNLLWGLARDVNTFFDLLQHCEVSMHNNACLVQQKCDSVHRQRILPI